MIGRSKSITIPANTPHEFWNDGEEEAHAVQWFKPALKIDRFFETYFALAHDGKLNDDGLPSFWRLAVMVPHFGDEIRLTKPPWGPPESALLVAGSRWQDAGIPARVPIPVR